MIAETCNINRYIAKDRLAGISFDKLTATFSSRSLDKIKALGGILDSDGIFHTVQRAGLWKWKLIMEIPIIDKYDDDKYQKIIGVFFILASRCCVDIGTIGLRG